MTNTNNSESTSHGQALTERRSFSTSQDYLLRARKHLALGVSSGFRSKAQPLPLYVDHGEGAWFWDVDGNRFLDHCLAWGPLILGHAHAAINEAVRDQLNRGYTYGAQCKLEFQVAERICELVPCAQRLLFVNTGTEAVQCALRVARAATGTAKIVKFEGHYHGWADNVLVSYHPSLERAGPPRAPEAVPAGHGQVLSAYSDTVVLPWNDESLLERYLDEHRSEVAAIIMEPILCNSGCLFPNPGYLESVRRLTERHSIALIFDEVITGFRVALGGAQALLGVVPDLAIFGKAVAGGFPLSVVAEKRELIEEVDKGRVVHAGTFNGNPIVLSAAQATLEVLARENGAILNRAATYGEKVVSSLRQLACEHRVPLRVHGQGTVFRPVFGGPQSISNYREFASADAKAMQEFVVELFHQGVYCVPDGRWYVSGVHGEAELSFLQEALALAFGHFAGQYQRRKEDEVTACGSP